MIARILAAVALTGFALPDGTAAAAPPVPLAPADLEFPDGPVIAQGHVVYVERLERAGARLRSRPLIGGPGTTLAEVGLRSRGGWRLRADAAGGVRWDTPRFRARPLTFAGPAAGPLEPSPLPPEGGLFLTAGRIDELSTIGPVRAEITKGRPRELRLVEPGGSTRRIMIPDGGDLRGIAVAGASAAIPVPRAGAIVILDLATGTEVRRVAVDGVPRRTALTADGELAVVTDRPSGARLHWAPAGAIATIAGPMATRVRALAVGAGRVAWTEPTAGQRGALADRVAVADGATGSRRFAGAPVARTSDLAFDGTTAAVLTSTCQLLINTQDMAPSSALPRGPCLRTQLVSDELPVPARPRTVRQRIRCVSAPGDSCRVTVTASVINRRTDWFDPIARRSVRVPAGDVRIVRLPFGRRAIALTRRNDVFVSVAARDPGGLSAVVPASDLIG